MNSVEKLWCLFQEKTRGYTFLLFPLVVFLMAFHSIQVWSRKRESVWPPLFSHLWSKDYMDLRPTPSSFTIHYPLLHLFTWLPLFPIITISSLFPPSFLFLPTHLYSFQLLLTKSHSIYLIEDRCIYSRLTLLVFFLFFLSCIQFFFQLPCLTKWPQGSFRR